MIKFIKNTVFLILLLFIVYASVTALFEYYFYKNKSQIELAACKVSNADYIEIQNIFNLPGLYIEFKDIEINHKMIGSIKIDKIGIHYNLFKLIFLGLPASIDAVLINNIDLRSGLKDIKDIINNYIRNNFLVNIDNRWKMINSKIKINRFTINLYNNNPLQTIGVINNLHFSLKHLKIHLDTDMSFNISSANRLNYFQASSVLNFDYNLSNNIGYGFFNLYNADLGEINLLRNERIGFYISNKIYLDYRNTELADIVKDNKGKISINIERDFDINNKITNLVYPFVNILGNGTYHFKFISEIDPQKYMARMSVQPLSNTNLDLISIGIESHNDSFILDGRINAGSKGLIMGKLQFLTNYILPSGSLTLNNFNLMDGLKISGDFFIDSSGNISMVYGKDTSINGGYLGSLKTKMTLISNEIDLASVSKDDNILINGIIRTNFYDINVSLSNIPGSAIVSNIHFNILNLVGGYYYGQMNARNGSNMHPEVSAKIYGFTKPVSDEGQKYCEASLKYKDNLLSFDEIHMIKKDIRFTGDFAYDFKNNNEGRIKVNGKINYRNKFMIPLHGEVKYSLNDYKIDTYLIIDNNIVINIKSINNSNSIKIKTDKYSLSNIGLAGDLYADIDIVNSRNITEQIKIDANYNLLGRTNILYIDSTNNNGSLDISQFELDTSDDKLIGKGNLLLNNEKLSGNLSFQKKGSLSFVISQDDFFASADIQNLFIKNFYKENMDVFVSTKINAFGSFDNPDYNGNIEITNSLNSENFILRIPSIVKHGNKLNLNNVKYQDNNYSVIFSADVIQNDRDLIVSCDGNFTAFQVLKGSYNLIYQSQNEQQYLKYNLYSIRISGKLLKDMTGNVSLISNRYQFNKKSEAGLTGFFYDNKNEKKWNFYFQNNEFAVYSDGNINNNKISSSNNLKLPLEIITNLNGLIDFKGQGIIRLNIKGDIDSPELNGNIKLNQTGFSINNLNTRIQNLDLDLPVEKSKLILQNIRLNTLTGNFIINGFIDLSDIQSPFIDVNITPDENKKINSISVNYNTPSLKFFGDLLINRLSIKGNMSSLALKGDIAAENVQIQAGFNQMQDLPVQSGLINNIKWDLSFKIGNRVKFSNEYIDAILRNNDIVYLTGMIGDNSFCLKGNIKVDRGSITYLGRDFIIKDGDANFNGNPGDFIPYINLNTFYRYKNSKNENVDIYLTFTGKVSKIILSDFYSVPDQSKSELSSILGIKSDSLSAANNLQTNSLSGISVVENAGKVLIFNPIALDLKRRLGLDLFSIKTGIIENLTRRSLTGDANINIFDGTSFTVGRYLLPNVFFQYEMTFSKNTNSMIGLLPLHSGFGI